MYSAIVNLSGLGGKFMSSNNSATQYVVRAYSENNQLLDQESSFVNNGDVYDIAASLSTSTPIAYIVVSTNNTGNGSGGSLVVKNIQLQSTSDVSDTIGFTHVDADGSTTSSSTTYNVTNQNVIYLTDDMPSFDADSGYSVFNLNINNSLVDTDGSEYISSVVISNVPFGATFNNGSQNSDGSWSFYSNSTTVCNTRLNQT